MGILKVIGAALRIGATAFDGCITVDQHHVECERIQQAYRAVMDEHRKQAEERHYQITQKLEQSSAFMLEKTNELQAHISTVMAGMVERISKLEGVISMLTK
jgi:hypothetical protein